MGVCVPFFMPELRDEFLIAFAQCRFLVCAHQPTAVQEKLSQRRTGKETELKRNMRMRVWEFCFINTQQTNKKKIKGFRSIILNKTPSTLLISLIRIKRMFNTPVWEGLQCCVHVTRISNVLHPREACRKGGRSYKYTNMDTLKSCTSQKQFMPKSQPSFSGCPSHMHICRFLSQDSY